MSLGAFGALLLSASLAHGQVGQSNPDGVRQVITAASGVIRPSASEKARVTVVATTITASVREVILNGNVVVQIEDLRVTADRAVLREDGEIRFEGNVRFERPAR